MSDLDPALTAILKHDLERFGSRPTHLPHDPIAERLEMRRRRIPWNVGGPDMARTREFSIELPGRSIPARIHWPTSLARGTVLYLHGGGWVAGDLDTHDRIVRSMAETSDATVVAIAYRKAPEHPFPAGLDDAVGAMDWLIREGPLVGLDTGALAVAGDSAGANLALAASQIVQSKGLRGPDAHVLFYGIYDADLQTESYRMLGDGRFGLSLDAMRNYWNLYLPDEARRRDPTASPLYGNLADIRRPLLIWAALDPLRDDSRKLAMAFNAAGCSAVSLEVHSMIHGFLHYPDRLAQARLAFHAAGQHLRHTFDRHFRDS